MILETLRMVVDALQTGSYGVNYQIASGSFSDSDTGPDPVLSFYDETRNAQVAQGQIPVPMNYPGIVVTLQSDPDLIPEVENNYRDAHIEICITAVIKDTDTERANTNTFYTLRAIEQCIRVFNSNAHAQDRQRNNIQIINATAMRHTKQFKNPDDGLIMGSLQITYLVRDIAP